MSPRIAVPLLLLVFAPGCIPTPEPVGDIDTAKPDERLIGTWTKGGDTFVIERSPVKGHPKGLLRVRVWDKGKDPAKGACDDTDWIFTAEVGKHTYGNMLVEVGKKNDVPALDTEGEYERWAKSPKRAYFVGKITFAEGAFAVDRGNEEAFKALVTKEKFGERENLPEIPAGWLVTYFEKNGPDPLFDGKNVQKYTRVKAK